MSTTVNHYSHQFILAGLGYLPPEHKLTLSWSHLVREAMLHWQQHLGMPLLGLPLEVNVVPPTGTEWMYSEEGYVLVPSKRSEMYIDSLLGAFRELVAATAESEPQTFYSLGFVARDEMPQQESDAPPEGDSLGADIGAIGDSSPAQQSDEKPKVEPVGAEGFGSDTDAGTPAQIPSTEPDRTVEQAKEAAPTPLPVDPVVPISPAGEPGQVKQVEVNESKEADVDPALGAKGLPVVAGAEPTAKKVEVAPTTAKAEAPARAVRPNRK